MLCWLCDSIWWVRLRGQIPFAPPFSPKSTKINFKKKISISCHNKFVWCVGKTLEPFRKGHGRKPLGHQFRINPYFLPNSGCYVATCNWSMWQPMIGPHHYPIICHITQSTPPFTFNLHITQSTLASMQCTLLLLVLPCGTLTQHFSCFMKTSECNNSLIWCMFFETFDCWKSLNKIYIMVVFL